MISKPRRAVLKEQQPSAILNAQICKPPVWSEHYKGIAPCSKEKWEYA